MRSVVAVLLGVVAVLTSSGAVAVAQELTEPILAPVDLEEVVSGLCNAALDDDWGVRRAAIGAMKAIDPAGELVLPLLLEVLKSDEANETRLIRAVEAIEAYGNVAALAIPALVELRSQDSYSLNNAINDALNAIGAPRVEDLPELIDLLDNETPSVRATAAEMIGRLGEQAVDAIPALMERLEDENADVRAAAARALGAIGPAANQAVPELIELLSDENRYLREAVWDALDSLGTPRLEDVETIRGLLSSSDPNVVAAAAGALGKLGAQAKQTVPEVVSALDAAPGSAAWALGEILRDAPLPPDEATAQAVEKLCALLGQNDSYVRVAAAAALGKIGPAANPALPKLIALLSDYDLDVRYVARDALQRVGEPRPEHVGELIELFEHKPTLYSHEAWSAAIQALEAIGPLSPEDLGTVDVNELVELLSSESWVVKSKAARALGQLRYGEAVDELASLLTDESDAVKAAAAWALGEILQGTTSPPADVVRALTALLEAPDEDEDVKIATLEAVANIYAREDVCSESLSESLYDYINETNELVYRGGGRAWAAVSSCWLQDEIESAKGQLGHKNPWIRKAGVETLGWIGPAASSAICPLMEALAQETVEEIKEAMIAALAAIGAPPPDCIAKLMEFLGHDEALVRKTAAEVLGRLGPDQATGDVVEKLLERVADDVDPSVRAAAAALGRLLARAE